MRFMAEGDVGGKIDRRIVVVNSVGKLYEFWEYITE
jgi:hypothetical protein